MPVRIVPNEAPTATDRAAIQAPLIAFNESRSPNPHYGPVSFALRDEGGATVGGLWGRSATIGCSSSCFSCPRRIAAEVSARP